MLLSACLAATLASDLLGWALTRSILHPLGAEPHGAAAIVRAVAQGDLGAPIMLKAEDSFSQMDQLKQMPYALTRVLASVRGHANTVAQASAEIAQSKHDRGARTEQQASALKQTSASMAQLGAPSPQVADIIGVIDGIASQTNILVLIAAVEATLAGEQGQGFAVVASEVRSLAQRSAEAAKEVKSLIGASVKRVELGSSLVGQAGATMTEVVVAIRRATGIVGQISTASDQQSFAVAQVGEAMCQIDLAPQQNAGLVEQSSVTAKGLRNQAQQLVQAVAVFRLDAAAAGHGGELVAVTAAGSRPTLAPPGARRFASVGD